MKWTRTNRVQLGSNALKMFTFLKHKAVAVAHVM